MGSHRRTPDDPKVDHVEGCEMASTEPGMGPVDNDPDCHDTIVEHRTSHARPKYLGEYS